MVRYFYGIHVLMKKFNTYILAYQLKFLLTRNVCVCVYVKLQEMVPR